MFRKIILMLNLFFLFSPAISLADDSKAPVNLEKALPFSLEDGKFVPDENKPKSFFNPKTPENVKKVFLDVIQKIKSEPVETIENSKEPAVTPFEFGPVFCLEGKNGFDVYFLDVSLYNNIRNELFHNYYFVIFDKKIKKCSERANQVETGFTDCYWDNLTNDGVDELVIDDGYTVGTGRFSFKDYYEIKKDLSNKKLFTLSSSIAGPRSSEEKIVEKMNGSVVIEEISSTSDIENSETKTKKLIKLNF